MYTIGIPNEERVPVYQFNNFHTPFIHWRQEVLLYNQKRVNSNVISNLGRSWEKGESRRGSSCSLQSTARVNGFTGTFVNSSVASLTSSLYSIKDYSNLDEVFWIWNESFCTELFERGDCICLNIKDRNHSRINTNISLDFAKKDTLPYFNIFIGSLSNGFTTSKNYFTLNRLPAQICSENNVILYRVHQKNGTKFRDCINKNSTNFLWNLIYSN